MKGSKCKFCRNYKSHTRIVSKDKAYDEVACNRHIKDLERDSDRILGSHNGVLRWHISSSGVVCRGEKVRDSLENKNGA